MISNYDSLLFKTDSYKFSHPYQYPNGMTSCFNHLVARGVDDVIEDMKSYSSLDYLNLFNYIIPFGYQYNIKKHLLNPITMNDVLEAESFIRAHGEPFHLEGWTYIAKQLNGKLPIRIRAVPEGTKMPLNIPILTFESTDENVPWIVGHLEPLILHTWGPTTVATKSWYTRKIILDSLNKTADDPLSEIEFKHHSFGYRGVFVDEVARIGGAAELLSSKGTDTLVGILCAMQYYNADMCGYSIPASEHSTITSYGKDGEIDAYRNMISKFGKPGAIFACVSDSYDLWNALKIWGTDLKQQIIDSGTTLVIRPDSGDPVEVVSKTLHILGEYFGYKINTVGFKVLNNVRVIQGDGINIISIKKILDRINSEGWSTTNIAFGQGVGRFKK